MKKRIISLVLTLAMLSTLISGLGIGVSAASMGPAPLSNPEISPVWKSGTMYTGYYDGFVSNSAKLKVEWDDVDADSYNVAVKALDGEPAPGENEEGTFLYDYTQNYTKTYISISKADIKSAAGKWVKVFVQSCYSDGTMYGCHYYFKVESTETETLDKPSITVESIGSSSLKVSWDKVSGATGYKIYRSTKTTSSSFTLIKTITSGSTTSWTDTGLEAETKYHYKVKAYNDSTESELSSRDSATTEEAGGAKFDSAPTLDLSIGGNYLGSGVYGTYIPGEDTIYFNCTVDYSDHIFVQTSSDKLTFTNSNGIKVQKATFVEKTSASTAENKSYTNGKEFQLYIDVPEGIPAGDYTISVTATDGVYDPKIEGSIAGTSYYDSVTESLTVRIGTKSSGGSSGDGNVDLTDERFANMGTAYKDSPYYQNLRDVMLTGNYADDIVTVAMSQLGYVEALNSQSVYGLFYGNNYTGENASWCAHFTNWCAGRAKIPSDIIGLSWTANPGTLVPNGKIGLIIDKSTYDANIANWKTQTTNGNLTFPWLSDNRVSRVDRSSYIPKKGDLIFWGSTGSRLSFTHVGIITEDSDGSTYSYIDGNGGSNGADNVSLQSNYKLSSATIIAYARPNYPTSGATSHTHSYTTNYEDIHPHAEYKECSCGAFGGYTGAYETLDNCTECYPFIPGDLNMDGKKDSNDVVTLMLCMYAQLPNRYPDDLDMNGDGVVDTNDIVYLLLHIYTGSSGSTLYPIK